MKQPSQPVVISHDDQDLLLRDISVAVSTLLSIQYKLKHQQPILQEQVEAVCEAMSGIDYTLQRDTYEGKQEPR
jgi:hypothetical protein